jgi:pyruvate dehydrogenase E1 component alpha subunit
MPRRDPRTEPGAAASLVNMWSIRRFEEAVEDLFSRGLLHGTMHLSIGQESVAEGVCAALDDGDLITSTHRGHGHTIAHGADLEAMMAELLMRDTGYCRGRGGSMHIADVEHGNLGANGIVAGSMTLAVGAALTQQLQDTGRVVACFFGEGAANEGAFHEAVNLAALWTVPVLFVCENNQYGMSMPQARSTAVGSVAAQAVAYGIPGVDVDGNDVVQVFERTAEAAKRARQGNGPTLLECHTYRYRGHSKSDRNLYRTQDEIDKWRTERDPIAGFESDALDAGLLDQNAVEAARDEARRRVRTAVEAAVRAPAVRVDDLEESVYA